MTTPKRPRCAAIAWLGPIALIAAVAAIDPAPGAASAPAAPPPAPAEHQASGPDQAGAPSLEGLADQALAKVRDRLQLTDDQSTRIRPLLIDHFATLRGLFVEYSGVGGPGMSALMQEIRDTRDRFQANLEPILTPAQFKEAQVIRQEVDQKLKDTVCDALVAALRQPVALTEEQIPRVRPILCDDFERKRAVLAAQTAPTGGPATRRPVLPEIEKIQLNTQARLREVLTNEQMQKYAAVRAAEIQKARQKAQQQ